MTVTIEPLNSFLLLDNLDVFGEGVSQLLLVSRPSRARLSLHHGLDVLLEAVVYLVLHMGVTCDRYLRARCVVLLINRLVHNYFLIFISHLACIVLERLVHEFVLSELAAMGAECILDFSERGR